MTEVALGDLTSRIHYKASGCWCAVAFSYQSIEHLFALGRLDVDAITTLFAFKVGCLLEIF